MGGWLLTAPRRRRGLSLLEVLIAMFVLMIGLLSVAALIPAGKYQAGEGLKADRVSTLALAAFHELKTRQILQPEFPDPLPDDLTNTFVPRRWMKYETSGASGQYLTAETESGLPTGRWMNASGHLYAPSIKDSLARVLDPLVIDPWSIAANDAASQVDQVAKFPANVLAVGAGGPSVLMSRLTLNDGLNDPPKGISPAVAETIFRSWDDIQFEIDARDRDKPPSALFDTSTSNNSVRIRRAAFGDYSWIVTLSPNSKPLNDPVTYLPRYDTADNSGQWTVSVVVFYKRRIVWENPTTLKTEPPAERMVSAKFNSGGISAGGGEVLLSTPNTQQNWLSVRRGEWMMLGPVAATGSIPESPAPYRWYKIIAIDAIESGQNNTSQRLVTLQGPDWNAKDIAAGGYGTDATASLFDGTIAVVEKNMTLETPSSWTE